MPALRKPIEKTARGGRQGRIRRMLSVEHYHAVARLLHTEPDPTKCWQSLLALAGLPSEECFKGVEIEDDIVAVAQQLREVWKQEPIPGSTAFLFFSLYDIANQNTLQAQAGFYLSGGDGDPIEQLTAGNLSYFPVRRQLRSNVLNQIKAAEGKAPSESDFLDYVLMLGGAALISREAVANLNVSLPVYAGFDSGDFVLASARR